jgi:hypothetical protein
MRRRSLAALLAFPLAGALALAGCGSGSSPATPVASSVGPSDSAAASGSETSVPRPSSSAQLTIVSPTPGESFAGGTVHVVVGLTGATIVSATTTDIRPDEGHIHLYVDNNLVSMNYGTTQDVEVAPGTHVMRAEFVASDHVPFNPRDVTPDVIFTVKP